MPQYNASACKFFAGILLLVALVSLDAVAQSENSGRWLLGMRAAAAISMNTAQESSYLGLREVASVDQEFAVNIERTIDRSGAFSVGIEVGATALAFKHLFSASLDQAHLEWTYTQRLPRAYIGRLLFKFNALRSPSWKVSSAFFVGMMSLSTQGHFDPNTFFSAAPSREGYTLKFNNLSSGSGLNNVNVGSLISASRVIGVNWLLSLEIGMQYGFKPVLYTQMIEASVIDPQGDILDDVNSAITTKGDRFILGMGVGYRINR